jgi:hypothetical protein
LSVNVTKANPLFSFVSLSFVNLTCHWIHEAEM